MGIWHVDRSSRFAMPALYMPFDPLKRIFLLFFPGTLHSVERPLLACAA